MSAGADGRAEADTRRGSWAWAVWTATRRGPGPVAGLCTAVVGVLHVALRSTWWRYEWPWAWYQYHFGTILTGPIAAGFAYVWGVSWHRARPVLRTTDRTGRVLAVAVLGIVLPVLAGFLVVLGGVSAVVGTTTGTLPDAATLITLASPVALLAACVALGVSAGFVIGNRGLAPLWALATFAVLMACYMVFPDRFAKVGGATASLVGLRPRPIIPLGQSFQFLGMAVLAVALAACGRAHTGPRRAAVFGGILLVVGLTVLWTTGPNEFEGRTYALTCQGSAPEICLADGWVAAEPELRTILGRYDRMIVAAGLPRLETYVQRYPAPEGATSLDPMFVLRYGPGGPSDGFLVNEWLPDGCWKDWDEAVTSSIDDVDAYLRRSWDADGALVVAPDEKARLADALRTIESCRA